MYSNRFLSEEISLFFTAVDIIVSVFTLKSVSIPFFGTNEELDLPKSEGITIFAQTSGSTVEIFEDSFLLP